MTQTLDEAIATVDQWPPGEEWIPTEVARTLRQGVAKVTRERDAFLRRIDELERRFIR